MFKAIADKLMTGEELSDMDATECINLMMENKIADTQKAAILALLRAKGVTHKELTAFAIAMRKHSLSLGEFCSEPLLDTCGTGGDDLGTFNISTAAGFVVASCGVKVAKHGNRAASSKCGSADLLEGLGVNIEIGPDLIKECIKETGFGFMFAKNHHPAMKHLGPVRKELGFHTIFNLLGPLCNPANTKIQVMGVFAPEWVPIIASVLKNLGARTALVVHGSGMDEFSICDETLVAELKDGRLKEYRVTPTSVGITPSTLSELKGGTIAENVKIVQDIFSGKKGPKTNAVLFNAAASLYAYGKTDSIKNGIQVAENALENGLVQETLNRVIKITNS